jgi:hypothetical protein
MVLIRLLNNPAYDPKKLLYHRKLSRFNSDNTKLLYLKPHINNIMKIKEYRLDKSNKKQYENDLQKLKQQLPLYYRVPLSVLDNIIANGVSRNKLLIILQALKIKRMFNYNKSYTFKIKDFLKDVYGDMGKMDLSSRMKELREMACDNSLTTCDISLTFCDISLTFCDISLTISDISLTNHPITN